MSLISSRFRDEMRRLAEEGTAVPASSAESAVAQQPSLPETSLFSSVDKTAVVFAFYLPTYRDFAIYRDVYKLSRESASVADMTGRLLQFYTSATPPLTIPSPEAPHMATAEGLIVVRYPTVHKPMFAAQLCSARQELLDVLELMRRDLDTLMTGSATREERDAAWQVLRLKIVVRPGESLYEMKLRMASSQPPKLPASIPAIMLRLPKRAPGNRGGPSTLARAEAKQRVPVFVDDTPPHRGVILTYLRSWSEFTDYVVEKRETRLTWPTALVPSVMTSAGDGVSRTLLIGLVGQPLNRYHQMLQTILGEVSAEVAQQSRTTEIDGLAARVYLKMRQRLLAPTSTPGKRKRGAAAGSDAPAKTVPSWQGNKRIVLTHQNTRSQVSFHISFEVVGGSWGAAGGGAPALLVDNSDGDIRLSLTRETE